MARLYQGSVAGLEDPSRVSEVEALGVPQAGRDLCDVPAAAGLGLPVARDQDGTRVEELGQCLLVAEDEGVLHQGLQLLGCAGSGLHEDA